MPSIVNVFWLCVFLVSTFRSTFLSKIYNSQRQRNRDHARSSRLRKRNLTEGLQHMITDLKKVNETLRTQAYVFQTKEEVDSILQARVSDGFEKFLTGLKQPENRVLDPETISFLESLRNDMIQSRATKSETS
jgi:Basic region leucine zipper